MDLQCSLDVLDTLLNEFQESLNEDPDYKITKIKMFDDAYNADNFETARI